MHSKRQSFDKLKQHAHTARTIKQNELTIKAKTEKSFIKQMLVKWSKKFKLKNIMKSKL